MLHLAQHFGIGLRRVFHGRLAAVGPVGLPGQPFEVGHGLLERILVLGQHVVQGDHRQLEQAIFLTPARAHLAVLRHGAAGQVAFHLIVIQLALGAVVEGLELRDFARP